VELLVENIARPDTIPERLTDAIVERLGGGRLELPMLPGAAVEVLRLAGSADVDAARLSEVLHRDQALAGHVLRIANSPAYGGQVRVSSLQQAIGRLGLLALRDVVVAVSVRTRAFVVPGYEKRALALWHHAVSTACWAKEIARRLRRSVESAFLCGLLHDVGNPVLLLAIHDIGRDTSTCYAPEIVEAALLHYHSLVGGVIATQWGLSERVVEAIYYHHGAAVAEDPTGLVKITRLADLLADALAANRGALGLDAVREDPVCAGLNLYPEDMDDLLALRPAVERISSEISG
jgi:HD-like signal output (HDOD) protein